jgi:hypothetical protein
LPSFSPENIPTQWVQGQVIEIVLPSLFTFFQENRRRNATE